MPEPLLYLEAMGAAAVVSAIFVLAVAGVRRPVTATRLNSACVLGMSLGLAIGYYVLSLRLAWPPVNGLDRFLTIVVPAVLAIELIAGFPRWVAWMLRVSLAAMIPRILLHGSVYLSGSGDGWAGWQPGAALAVCGGLLAGSWGLLAWLSQRSPGASIPLALCLSTLCAGLTVMMAGYIKGGAAAFPLAATLVATTIAAKLMTKHTGAPVNFTASAISGIGVVGLFGLLFIGRFFGRLSTDSALAMLLAPLLCWATETPLLRKRKPWLVGSIRLVLVAIPLVVVLALAKRDFDRDMAPLLSTGIAPALPRGDGVDAFVRWPSKAVVKHSTALEGHRTGFISIARSSSLLDNPDRANYDLAALRGDAMLSVQERSTQFRGRMTRRELMRVGGLSLFGGMTVLRLLEAAGDGGSRPHGRARSVILFNLLGGPSHQDMFDMKPQAPAEIRGEFQPIATSLPGLQICEHLPNTARLMHKACLIRSVTHNYNAHNPLNIMTGFLGGDPNQLRPLRTDPPDIGAICQYLEMGPSDMPGAFCLPCYPGFGERSQYPGIRRPGPYGGFLGNQYDPLFAVCNPTFDHVPERKYYDPVWPMGEPMLPLDESPVEMTLDRFNERRTLLQQFDDQFRQFDAGDAVSRMNRVKQQAFAMIRSSRTRDAFDLARESDETRERYGRNLHGSSMLVARRLVEAGVPFISVHAENFIPHGFTYDMHENNFGMLKNYNLPVLDKCYPALVEDLESRGLLDSTLIVVMGEMGRSPKVNDKAGRDHWPQCGFCLLTGGGVTPGSVFGASDKHAAYPVSDAVSPSDIVATIYHLLGIDPHLTVDDPAGRPIPIAHGGNVIRDIVA